MDTLQHKPSSIININLHAQILGTSGRGEWDFHELNEACHGVGRWQLDTIIYRIVSMPSHCTTVELEMKIESWDLQCKQGSGWNQSYSSPPCAIYIRSIKSCFSKFHRLRLSVLATAEAENTSQHRKAPAACQPAERREGVACLPKNRARHQLGVSERPGSGLDCLPESSRLSLAPSGSFQEESAWFRASWSRRMKCFHSLHNVPTKTYTHTHTPQPFSLRMERQPTPCCTWAYIGRRPNQTMCR